ncbi:MAG: spore coat protein [Solirubrobacterales bacterium]
MNEKDMMHDLLASEKLGLSTYSAGIMESSCTNLRNTLMDNYKKTQDLQYKVFDTMNQKGWYQTKDADSNEVQQVKDQANQMMGELK